MFRFARHLPWLILIVGGVVSTWAAWKIRHQVEVEARSAFRVQAHEIQAALAMQFQRYEDLLFGAAGLYRADHEVTQEEFSAYAAALNIGARFKALSSFNYAEYFRRPQREQFEREYLEMVGPRATAPLKLALERDEHMVITRTVPEGAPILGFDLMNGSHRMGKHVAFTISGNLYRRNVPVSSGLPLIERGRTPPVLALRLGVFVSDGVSVPRLLGTVGLTFRIADFFEQALPAAATGGLKYRVENIGRNDGTVYNPPVEIYTSARQHNLDGDADDVFRASFIQPFGGALIRIELSESKASFLGDRAGALPFFVFASGLLFFGLIATIVRILVHRKFELAAEIKERTVELEKEILRAKQLERELASIVEEERRRIGHELHDEIGQRLTGMSLAFRALAEKLRPGSHDLSKQVAGLEENARQTIASVRTLTQGLIPVPEGPAGLRTALEQLAASTTTPQTQCIFDYDDPVDVNDETVAANLYRIAQEATNNALKHANPTRIVIRLDEEDGKVVLTIDDDGIGFQCDDFGLMLTPNSTGSGLRIMAHRASVINYTLQIESYRGRGTTIKVREC